MASKQYMSPADRQHMDGASGMGSMGNAPGPGQLEGDGGGYNEDGPPAPPEEKEGAGETATISSSLLGGADLQPGAQVMMTVVKMDKENGTVELKYSPQEEKPGMGGMDEEHPAVAAMP